MQEPIFCISTHSGRRNLNPGGIHEMTKEVKDIVTTMEGQDRREAVAAMETLLGKIRQLPGWPTGPIVFTLPDGRRVEVESQDGETEVFAIFVRPAT